MPFCTQCGTAAQDGRFCARCGAALPASVAERSGGAGSPGTPSYPAASHIQSGAAPGFPSLTGDAPGLGAGVPVATPRPPIVRTDALRDLGTVAVLIAVLVKPWSWGANGGETVYVLLAVLCSLASLVPEYLRRANVGPDGQLPPWPIRKIRLVLNTPLAVVLAVELIRNLVAAVDGGDDGTLAAGPGYYIAGFAVALAAAPRYTDVADSADAVASLSSWRKVAGWCAGTGAAFVVVITFIPLMASGSGGGMWFVFALIFVGMIAYVALALAVPVIRVGADHPAWQPIGLWLGGGLVFAIVVGTSTLANDGGGSGGWQGWLLSAGFWLMVSSTGLCAVPLRGGNDGDTNAAPFWELIVANAFRFLVVTAGVLLALLILLLIMGSVQGSNVGLLVVTVLMAAVFVVAAKIGSSRLRAGGPGARRIALKCVGVMFVDSIVLLVLSAVTSNSGSGFGDGLGLFLPLYFGPFVVIAFGLMAPKAIRRSESAPFLPSSAASPVGYRPDYRAPATDPEANPSPYFQGVPVRQSSAAAGAYATEAPVIQAGDGDDAEKTVLRRRPAPFNAGQATEAVDGGSIAIDAAAVAASNPQTPLNVLSNIAQTRPDLRAALAENPSTYPELLQWLGQLGDPEVNAALARRPS